MCMFCRSLFVLLYFFIWPLCCLFFFDIRILITPLVSSNSSHPQVSCRYQTTVINRLSEVVAGDSLQSKILRRKFWGNQGKIKSCKSKNRILLIQWPKKKDKQHLQNNTQNTIDQATRTPLKSRGELGYFGRVGSYCSTLRTFSSSPIFPMTITIFVQ
jgi:hypothetical protein